MDRRRIALAIALAACHAFGIAHTQETLPSTSIEPVPVASRLFRQQLATAHSLNRAGRHADADRLFARLIDDAEFSGLALARQHAALSAAGWAAVQLHQRLRAIALYERALRIDGSDPEDWYQLAAARLDEDRPDEAAVAFIEVVERWPHLLHNVPDRVILNLASSLDWESPQRFALLQALFDANWSARFGRDDAVWYDLAVAQAERGDMRAALSAIRRIDSPLPLVRLRSDRRFDSILQTDASAFDTASAARRWIEALRDQSELSPDDLEARSRLSRALLVAGRDDEVLALVEQSLDAIVDASSDKPAFTDLNDQIWLMNNRAIALRRMGRTDEALAELVRAGQLTEDGGPNVSQRLNLGVFECSLDRPREALGAIASLDQVNGYGRMVEASVRHCAARQQGKRWAAARALRYLNRNRDDAPLIYLEALLRARQLDEASALLRGMLDSPARRADALVWAQDYLRPAPLPGDVDTRDARAALLAREDVSVAIARVGRVERYDLYLEGSMD